MFDHRVSEPQHDAEKAIAYAQVMTADIRTEQTALVALLQRRPHGLTWPKIVAEVVAAGSAVYIWTDLNPPALLGRPGEPDPLDAAGADIDSWIAQGLAFVTVLDSDYPARLREIHQAPPVLFARGDLRSNDVAVSVVGSRAASERGLKIAQEIAQVLVKQDVSVVAGLAAGIDSAAHQAAIDAGGRTVAVIGTGINRSYPATNRELQHEIGRKGLLLSQFWPDAPPQKHTFLMRNATMSGYGIATVVVEAGEKSGARAQARMAVEHGRPVILTDLVVERNQWAQGMIGRPGVHVASGIEDVSRTVSALLNEHARLESEILGLVSV